MARVLVVHAPQDEEAAHAFARAIADLGHEVYVGNADDPALTGQIPAYHATIVLWSPWSIYSTQVLEKAGVAHTHGSLVSVRLPELDLATLPQRLRRVTILPAEDMEAIQGALAALEPTLAIEPEPPPTKDGVTVQQERYDIEQERYDEESSPGPGDAEADAKSREEELAAEETAARNRAAIEAWENFERQQAEAEARRRQAWPPREAPRRVGASEPAPDVGAAEASPARLRRSVAGGASDREIGAAEGPRFELGRTRNYNRIEGVGAADTPTRRPAPASPAAEALHVEAGKLVHKIPNKMWLGEPETVEVRIGREAAAGLATGLVGRGGLTEENIPIVETMSVSLYARGGAFEIERQSETTQLVKADAVRDTLFGTTDFGRWVWLVTPKKTGAHNLVVKVSAGLKDSRGVPTSATLPDREFTVSVSVHAGRATAKALGRFLPAAGGVIVASVVGAITQDYWWPWLKALLFP